MGKNLVNGPLSPTGSWRIGYRSVVGRARLVARSAETDHNAVWNEWVDPKNPPARAGLQSPQLWRPGMRRDHGHRGDLSPKARLRRLALLDAAGYLIIPALRGRNSESSGMQMMRTRPTMSASR